MPYQRNQYMNFLYVVLILNTAYTFLWTRFGLGVASVVQYTFLIILLYGLLKYIISPYYRKNSFSNWLIILWVFQLFSYYLSNSNSTTKLKEATFVLLVILPFVSQVYNPRHNKYAMLLTGFISVMMFFVSMSLMLTENENAYGGGYLSLVALPIVLYYSRNETIRKKVFYACIILLLVFISMKRGDILACVLAIISYFFINSKGKFDFKIIFVFLFIIGVGYIIYNYMLQNSPTFAWKVQQTLEGDSSGRDVIYSTLWQYFLNAPLDVKLLGGGFDATVNLTGLRAHSDWLETLTCQGLIGVLVYAAAYLSLVFKMLKIKDTGIKAVISTILIIWLVKSIFSMFIFSTSSMLLFALTGYILNIQINKQYEY